MRLPERSGLYGRHARPVRAAEPLSSRALKTRQAERLSTLRKPDDG
jgi:hypothetical protein